RIVDDGDFILSNSMSFGRPYIMKTTGAIHDGWLVLRKKLPDIDKDFFYYLLGSPVVFNQFDNLAAGSTVRNLNTKLVASVEVPFPSLLEQKRIVKVLDEVFSKLEIAKNNLENNVQNTKILRELYLQSIFAKHGKDWEESSIGKTCNLMTGGTPSKARKEYFQNGTINWLVSGDINKKEIRDCDGKITKLGLEKSNTKYLPLNSVMIALNGQGKTRGTVAMLRIKATCNQSLVSIYPKDDLKLLPELVFANLDGRYNEIRRLTGDTGNDRRGLNMPIIRNIKFSFPKSIIEQKAIVKKLDELSEQTKKLEVIYKKKLADLEELKKSVLKKAFTGML
ncbi:MAG: restriction endonuclease subunit S, partial [bacterium]